MSSLWTPGGERPVGRDGGGASSAPASAGPSQQQGSQPRQPAGFAEEQATPEQGQPNAQEMEELRRQLAETPAEVVVSNHCFGLFELAALHMSLQPPQLGEAQLAIDALAALLENLTGRLGEAESHLKEGLGQLQVAFVQVRQSAEGPQA